MEGVSPNKVLLFVSDHPENLKVVTNFLTKRNFTVHVETEIKNAVVRTFEIKPDFIFIAWDHRDKKVTMLPELMGKSTTSIIVPFINKNTKESVFKFENCPINPKVFPPISGPAVERVILKSSKEEPDFLEKVNRFKSMTASPEQLQALQNDLARVATDDDHPMPPEAAKKPADKKRIVNPPLPENLEKFKEQLEQQNTKLEQPKQSLSSDQVENLKETLAEQVVAPLENILAAYEQQQPEADEEATRSDLIFQKGAPSTTEHFAPIIQAREGENSNLPSMQIFKASDPEKKTAPVLRAHCIRVISDSWCGYFSVLSKAHLDFRLIDTVFSDWIKLQMKNMDEINERDYFEFDNVPVENLDEIQVFSDYCERVKAHGQDFQICFFGVEAVDMKIEMSPDGQHVQIYTRDIPTGVTLDFSLYLHLPENRKFLLYTQRHSALNGEQKERLLSKNVTKLYTGLDDEYEYRKFLARKTFNRLFDIINEKMKTS